MAGKEKVYQQRLRPWTARVQAEDPDLEKRAAKQLNATFIGDRKLSFDLLREETGSRVEVKRPDSSGEFMVPRAGREAAWRPLCELFEDLSIVESSCFDIDADDISLIERYKSCAGEVSKGLSAPIAELFARFNYNPSHDICQLVKPSVVLEHVDELFLAFDDGWMLINREDFDVVLEYSRCTRGLVKLALIKGRKGLKSKGKKGKGR